MAAALDSLITAQLDVQNFALVTHSVPADRVRAHVPPPFELETFTDEHGSERTLVSASCFCNRQLHWSPTRYPALDFDQSTFRTYVTYEGRRGAYFFGTYVSTRLSFAAQSLLVARSFRAEYDVEIDADHRGYHLYSCRAVTDGQELSFELTATDRPEAAHPFATGEELAQFITYRLHGFAKSPFRHHSYGPVEHRRLRPWSGTLHTGRFDFWEQLGILSAEEARDAYSVLVEPSVRFTLRPPRPVFAAAPGDPTPEREVEEAGAP